MGRKFDFISKTFYDPLYEVVVFSKSQSEGGPRSYWEQGPPDAQAVTSEQFVDIIETYEFSRLNFLRQAGLAWLVFPSATHTRFSHSLGCWLLSEWAADNVFVEARRVSENKSSNENAQGTEFVRLGQYLNEIGWLEEFQLALLLHDIGHFPFSHVIENNYLLKDRFLTENELDCASLNHEHVGCSLLHGKDTRIFNLYKEYLCKKTAGIAESDRFLSDILHKYPNIDIGKIAYLIDGSGNLDDLGLSKNNVSFIKAVHELVSGVIDLDRIDHYHRDSHFISIKGGDFNVQGLLHHMAIVNTSNSERMRIQLIEDGVGHAFRMLYAKVTLTQTVFHNVRNLAYEVMMNAAINEHWDDADKFFRKYLIYFDDSELMNSLCDSSNLNVRKIVQGIRMSSPFTCVGKFYVSEELFNELGENKIERKAAFLLRFKERMNVRNLNEKNCFIRFSGLFGKSDTETDWMDLGKILGDDGVPLAKMEDHGKFVEFIHQQDKVSSRTFWIFISDISLLEDAKSLGRSVAGTK